MPGLGESSDELGPWPHRCRGSVPAAGAAVASRPPSPLSNANERPTQNWHDPGESDCLIKTKHCDGRKSVLTQCDFCPVL